MPDPHAPAVVEVDHFRGLTEPQHVRGQHAMMRGEGRDVAFPTQFGSGTVLAAMKQDDGIASPGFEIARGQTGHVDGFALELH